MARNRTAIGTLAAVVVIFTICTATAPALAGDYGGDAAGMAIGLVLGGLAVEGIVAGYGIINAGGNTYYAIAGERPSGSWILGGYISGVLNIGLGIAVLCLIDDSNSSKWNDTLLGVGLGNLAIGALDIGSSIWAGKMPEKTSKSIRVAPLIMRDVEGNPAVGIGLNLVNW